MKYRWFTKQDATPLETQTVQFVSRSHYQVFTFDMPTMKPEEIESSVRFKVRSLSPLHPDQYKVYLQAIPVKNLLRVVTFLVPNEAHYESALQQKGTYANFPLKIQSPASAEVFLALQTPEGVELYQYRDRILFRIFPPFLKEDSFEKVWSELRAEYTGALFWTSQLSESSATPFRLPEEFTSVELFSISRIQHFPTFLEKLPQSRPYLIPILANVFAVVVLLAWLIQVQVQKESRNQEWESWLKQIQKSSTVDTATLETRYNSLKDKVGLPLAQIYQKIAIAWVDGVKIRSLQIKGTHLTIEAECRKAVDALERLVKDPFFKAMKAVQIRSLTNGQEALSIEGDLTLDS